MSDLGLTVKQLKEIVDEQIKKGNGNKHVLLTADDEGNGVHALFFGFTDQDDEENFDLLLEFSCDDEHNIDNSVILG